ncbi:MAG: DUF4838 domain-containing protein [Candidatus Cryptobacteroides sp.]
MKKILLALFATFILTANAIASDAVLYRNGRTDYRIILSRQALPAELTAVRELATYLEKIAGTAPLAYYDTDVQPGKHEIIVGKTNREDAFPLDRTPLGEEGLMVRWKGSSVFITGPRANYGRGTLYAAYEFLRQVGCEFYAKDTEVIPHDPDLRVTKKDIVQVSPFEHRDIYWSCVFGEEISAKLRLNACLTTEKRNLRPEYGGMRTYTANKFVHTFDKIIPPEVYFESHPEYFSEINGERTCRHLYSQICMTNPDVLRLTVEKVKEWIREDPESRIISVSQNDSFVIDSYCDCEKCHAINEEEGSPAGSLLRFTNAVADAIREEFPDVAVDMLAYQYSTIPPRITKPRDNVIVRYCTGACYPHPIDECQVNAGPKSYIEKWNQICNRLYIWDYTTNFAQYLCPIANFASLQPNLQFFRDHGVKGVFEQGMYQEGESGEFGDLRAYVLARLMWNPDEDMESLVTGFMDAFYGDAAAHVREFLDLLQKRVLESGVHFGPAFDCGDRLKGLFSPEDLEHLDEVWEKAVSACMPGSKELLHVQRSQICYRFYKQCCKVREFAVDPEAEGRRFAADCHRLGIVRLNEGANIPWVEVE